MKTSVAGQPPKASIAAAPVSPEVAPRMVAALAALGSARSIARPSHCMAKSLKASVGPWNSSSAKRLGSIWTSGAVAAWRKPA